MRWLVVAVLLGAGLVPAAGDAVRTDSGWVRGAAHADYREFQGIPYAAPPVGNLRWQAPTPRAPWSGVLPATKPGPRCAQHESVTGTPASEAEDCLYLNVTTPRKPGLRPVMVWLHGGGFVEGAGSEYDAHRLAVRGGVVVVTINYRLGIFGNFGYPGLAGSGAFGLQDQQAALRWVRQNARAFGGNPHNVTIFGQSAGGQSVCAQLTSPAAAGLFQRAIIQSAFCTRNIPANALLPGLPAVPPWEAPQSLAARGQQITKAIGCADLQCLRDKKPSTLMPYFGYFAGLSYGSTTLPENPTEAIRAGRIHRVPVMSGTTRDEGTFLQALNDFEFGELTKSQYDKYLTAFGAHEPEVASRYPVGKSYSHNWASIVTDSGLACPTLERNGFLARRVPVYAYEFADRTAPPVLKPATYPYGAYHSADAVYLFDLTEGTVRPTLDPRQQRLATAMIDYWTAFAGTGSPNVGGLPRWSGTMSLAPDALKPVDVGREHQCEFWLSR